MGESIAEVAAIAATLTKAQRNTVTALGEKACGLGCSASCADRLAWPTKSRPALVKTDGIGMARLYWLTAIGIAVRNHLISQGADHGR